MKRIAMLTLLAGSALSGFAGIALAQDAQLPITKVSMFRSGVASYERSGMIDGNKTLRLLFDPAALDDVLKSLVILDSGGAAGTVSYTVSEPLARRLAALGLSDGDLSLDGLLGALRGTRINYNTGGPEQSGVVLGLSVRKTAGPDGGVSQTFLSLMDGARIESIPVNSIVSFEIQDESLRDEFAGVITELNRQRGELQKAVDVSLTGEGRRMVRAMYVAPAPVWKTTYRLVLGEGSSDDATIVGWAIVENTSDQDWEDVTLSLISGRPVGFTMPVSEPIFADRPELAVPLELAMNVSLFEAGAVARQKSELDRSTRGRAAGRFLQSAPSAVAADAESMELADAIGQQIESIATSSGDAGEMFVYTIDMPVSVDRQSSAMIPIIGAEIEAERVSILSQNDQKNPMRGARLVNETGLELLAGPITVFGDNTYQGDALIDRVGRGETRMIAYAQDLDVVVERQNIGGGETTSIRIMDGTYMITRWIRQGTTYSIENKDERRGRTLVIEHQKLGGWELESDAKPVEETPGVYRFDVEVGSGGSETFRVSQKRIDTQRVGLTSMGVPTILQYSRDGAVPKAVRDALKEYAAKRQRMDSIERTLEQLRGEITEIERDQQRVRGNMGALDRQSDLYRRYVQTLDEGEDRLMKLRTQIDQQEKSLAELQAETREWLRTLRAG